jgi:hypothetical protein
MLSSTKLFGITVFESLSADVLAVQERIRAAAIQSLLD